MPNGSVTAKTARGTARKPGGAVRRHAVHSPMLPAAPCSTYDSDTHTMNHFVFISGCSGGGKSTLLTEPAPTRICRGGKNRDGASCRNKRIQADKPLPWLDMVAFLRRAISMAREDHANAAHDNSQWVFFNRAVIDAATAVTSAAPRTRAGQTWPAVSLPPPCFPGGAGARTFMCWIAEHRHDMAAALLEFEQLQRTYPALGYTVSLLPAQGRRSAARRHCTKSSGSSLNCQVTAGPFNRARPLPRPDRGPPAPRRKPLGPVLIGRQNALAETKAHASLAGRSRGQCLGLRLLIRHGGGFLRRASAASSVIRSSCAACCVAARLRRRRASSRCLRPAVPLRWQDRPS